uniref:Uncharacterized protein n=1 Tax=Rhizophora mucronata TaxID=61149 RepID=A0A2P2NDT2_RHIMU
MYTPCPQKCRPESALLPPKHNRP